MTEVPEFVQQFYAVVKLQCLLLTCRNLFMFWFSELLYYQC